MCAGIFSSSFKYYWLAICVLVLFAVTVWYCKCRGQDQRRREEVLAREMIIQRLNTATAPPSNYHSDAPPAYDDVINKPEDYPVYQAQATSISVTSSPPAGDLTQNLPSYEDVVRMPVSVAVTRPNEPEERREISDNLQQVEQRTITDL